MSIVKILVPEFGESIKEVTLASLLVNDGDFVNEGDSICELESDKASMEIPADSSGRIKFEIEVDSEIEIGGVLGTIDTSATPPSNSGSGYIGTPEGDVEVEKEVDKKQVNETTTIEINPQETSQKVSEIKANHNAANWPSPAARKILAEKNISSEKLIGTGKDGRITKSDALLAREVETGINNRGVRAEKMTRLRKTISKRLVEAKNTTAMLTTFNEVDMTEIMELRKKYKDDFKEKHGVSLGFMSFFTRACCIALADYPIVGAIIEEENILFHDYSDIGIAVSTPRGLVVPVVRNANSMGLAQIESEIRSLAVKAREGRLSIDEMRGGNFTITNGGTFGSMLSTPIINIPQSAILGMHNIVERPHVVNGEIKIRPIMYLALSYDHRIIDGKDSVSFLVKVKEVLEKPAKELLEKNLLGL